MCSWPGEEAVAEEGAAAVLGQQPPARLRVSLDACSHRVPAQGRAVPVPVWSVVKMEGSVPEAVPGGGAQTRGSACPVSSREFAGHSGSGILRRDQGLFQGEVWRLQSCRPWTRRGGDQSPGPALCCLKGVVCTHACMCVCVRARV